MTIETIKFSEFTNGGDLNPDETIVGVASGANARFTTFPMLPPGTTAERPTPAAAMYYRLRFNTSLASYEYYSPVAVAWIQLSDSEDVIGMIGTANQVLANGTSGVVQDGVVTLTTPQDIASVSSPTFNALTLSTPLSGASGGTGVNNSGKTITIGGNLATLGPYASIFTMTGATNVTFPTSGTLATTSSAFAWSTIAGTTQMASVNNGYIIGNAAQTTVTLPAAAQPGDIVRIQGLGAAGWILQASGGQTIQIGSSATTSGGTVTSSNQYDSIEVVCIAIDTTWSMGPPTSAGFTVA